MQKQSHPQKHDCKHHNCDDHNQEVIRLLVILVLQGEQVMADVNSLTQAISLNTDATTANSVAVAALVAQGSNPVIPQALEDQINTNTANLNATTASIPVVPPAGLRR